MCARSSPSSAKSGLVCNNGRSGNDWMVRAASGPLNTKSIFVCRALTRASDNEIAHARRTSSPHVSVLPSDLSLDQGPDRPVRRLGDPAPVPARRCWPRARTRSSGSPRIRATSRSLTARSSRTSAATSRSPRRPGQLGDHAGNRRGRRLHRAPDRVGRVRRRDRPLPRHDAQGEAVPAHAAPRARVLPLAPAPRDLAA